MSGLVVIARYISDPIRFAYPNLDNDVVFSSSGVSSELLNLMDTSISVDTGFASCNPYLDKSLPM